MTTGPCVIGPGWRYDGGCDWDSSHRLTSKDGAFAFDSVTPGPHFLRIDAPGFRSRHLPLNKAAKERDINIGSVMLQIGEIFEGPLVAVKASKKEKPMTVCESLAAPRKLSRKPVAIVGRIECGSSLIDYAESPSTMPAIDKGALAKKLSLIRKTNTLGLHTEPRLKIVGNTVATTNWGALNLSERRWP